MNMFVFTGIIWQEEKRYSALCPELDVATQGETSDEARGNLLEAATLPLEGSIEDGLPYLRPVPVEKAAIFNSNGEICSLLCQITQGT